jgi:hypothetical protein
MERGKVDRGESEQVFVVVGELLHDVEFGL